MDPPNEILLGRWANAAGGTPSLRRPRQTWTDSWPTAAATAAIRSATVATFSEALQLLASIFISMCTGGLRRIHLRKRRETKLQPSSWPGLSLLGCSLASLHFRS